ncbi:Os01g0245700 [Oryza sativa Japonica Group]|uniref:Os01g0245700 protein n=1 Tax=Oryza sativa subsp. japonica TaxID=39947 RepID=C7IXB8_ORYSJ|nr:Os01g0245700 [Oryza sativa Japonica Group]|eukprot:NP_001172254.1 Os01g0245700 [Oryza sativa Japonica Group]
MEHSPHLFDGAAPKFRRDERMAAPPREATWVILACVPSVSSSDSDFEAGDHLAFDWRDPPGVSLLTLRQSDSVPVSPAPRDFCPDRDDHPYVVAVDSAGGLLLRGARRSAHDFGPGVALGFDPAPSCTNDGGYILCHATLRMAYLYPPCSDEYRLLCAGNVGMIRRTADRDHPIRLLAELQIESGNGIHRATLLRYSHELGGWASTKVNYPPGRRSWCGDGVIVHAGMLWWVDLSFGLLTCDVFAAKPDMRFVPLPEGCKLPYSSDADHAKHRCVNVSDGELAFVQIHDYDTAAGRGAPSTIMISMWTLQQSDAGEESVWSLRHRVRVDEIWDHVTYRKTMMPRRVPVLALLHPKELGVVFFFQITSRNSWMFAVDLVTRIVLECKKYKMPQLPTMYHSSRHVRAWELPHSICRGEDDETDVMLYVGHVSNLTDELDLNFSSDKADELLSTTGRLFINPRFQELRNATAFPKYLSFVIVKATDAYEALCLMRNFVSHVSMDGSNIVPRVSAESIGPKDLMLG